MAHAAENEDGKIAILVSMGFDASASHDALEKNEGDLDRAIDYLLSTQTNDDAVDARQENGVTEHENSVDAASEEGPRQEQSLNSILMGRETLEAYCLYLGKSDDEQAAKSSVDSPNTEESITPDSLSEMESLFHSESNVQDDKDLNNNDHVPSIAVSNDIQMPSKLAQSSAKDDSAERGSSHSVGDEQIEQDLETPKAVAGNEATTSSGPFHGEFTPDCQPSEVDGNDTIEQAPKPSQSVTNNSVDVQGDVMTPVLHVVDMREENTVDAWNEKNGQGLVAGNTASVDETLASNDFVPNPSQDEPESQTKIESYGRLDLKGFIAGVFFAKDDSRKGETEVEPAERLSTSSEATSNNGAPGFSDTEAPDASRNIVGTKEEVIHEASDEHKENNPSVLADLAENHTMPVQMEGETDDFVNTDTRKKSTHDKQTSLECPLEPRGLNQCELEDEDLVDAVSEIKTVICAPNHGLKDEKEILAYSSNQNENGSNALNPITNDTTNLSSNEMTNAGDDARNQENELARKEQVQNTSFSLETVPCHGAPLPPEMVATVTENNVIDGKIGGLENVESIRCNEAPLPAEMTVNISEDHVANEKESEISQHRTNPSRRSVDPPADFELFPGKNLYPSSYSDTLHRKKALLKKLHLAGIAVPASSFAQNEPASDATTAEIDSSVSSHPRDCTTTSGQSNGGDPISRTDYTIQSSSLPESTSDQVSSSSGNRVEPPEFIGLHATRVDPTPIYNAIVVPSRPVQQEVHSFRDEDNSSTDHGEVCSSIASLSCDRGEQNRTGNASTERPINDEQAKVPWWKKYKMRAFVAILIISFCGVTAALAATMTQQKKKRENTSSKSIGFTSNEVIPDKKNPTLAARVPSMQPSTLLFESSISETSFENVFVRSQVPATTAPVRQETMSVSALDSSNLDSLSQQPTIGKVLITPSTSPPAEHPTKSLSLEPSDNPSTVPTASPTTIPSKLPSENPSPGPTDSPSQPPSTAPTTSPSYSPSHTPTEQPTVFPTSIPTAYPTHSPTNAPTNCIPCYWSDIWSEWSECSSVCDGVKTRTRDCICGPHACPGWCEGSDIEEAPCNESRGRIRFKTHNAICSDWGGCWLHVNNDEIQASDAHYTYFQQCGDGYLSIEGKDQCLEAAGAFSCNQSPCQEWRIITIGDYFFQIKNICDDCCLDASSDGRRLGAVGEQRSVTCRRCDTVDYGQLWVTWDSPAICGSDPCIIFPPPTRRPTRWPTWSPTREQTRRPTHRPTHNETRRPTRRPTYRPTREETRRPTRSPIRDETLRPTAKAVKENEEEVQAQEPEGKARKRRFRSLIGDNSN